MELINFLPDNGSCSPSKKIVEGCASGVSYMVAICQDGCDPTPTLTYINMSTGLGETEAPDDFVLGNCIDARATAEEVLVGDEKPEVGDLAPTGSKLFFDTVSNKITHANVDGVWVEIADSSLTFSDILASGNKILTITDADGNETEVFETITDVTAITNGFRYTNESGVNDDITFEINNTDPLNTKVEVKLNGTKVAEFPLYTVNNDIQINNNGSEWDFTDDQITILETNGDSQVLNFPYRVTVVTNPNGTIDIKQNGVTIGTVPAPVAETVTTLTNTVTGNKIGTYTNEAGVAVDINETITSVSDLSIAGNVITLKFIDETGTENTKTVTVPSDITTTITDVLATGNIIGTYTNELGAEVDLKETITSIGTITYNSATGVLTIPYTDEAGVLNNKTVTLPAFKELNQWHVDKNSNDTTGTGADENPYLTITKALSVATQADVVIVNEGTYAEAVTISTQNLTLRGQGQEYGGLTEINSLSVTANGTSVRVSSLTVLGNTTHTGTSPLYLADVTLNGNYTSSSTAYAEIKNSRLQDGTISKTAAGILFIQDSLIGNATFSTANSVISLRNVTIDAGDVVTIGAGVIYSLADVVGNIIINAGAIPLETAILAQGGTALVAKLQECSTFNDIRLTNVNTISTATKMLVRDADGIVREQVFSSGLPTGGTDGQVLTVQPDGSYAWESLPDAPVTGGQNVYFDAENPASGTIFDTENPPITNNDALKEDSANTYYGTDGSVWTWNGTAYVTKVYNFPTHQPPVLFTATAGQTSFASLPKVPVGAIWGRRNSAGRQLSFTNVGTTVIYTPANNGGMTMDAGDIVEICYESY